ncbi:hypothetical protein DPMN_044582 [Dreissena polymorpha]|uniref:Uncharacterized protein n=1 Tax=Dreissena polymorpha TaxID=45954 RepID=A0A9D4I0M2_DREPO|nr:hypothetical protein DPMN_044582 [Dreissena polymorpha]
MKKFHASKKYNSVIPLAMDWPHVPTAMRSLNKWIVLSVMLCILHVADAETSSDSTTATPFIKTPMFIGLTAGVGGFIAFIILCCVVWKCFCGGQTDRQRRK